MKQVRGYSPNLPISINGLADDGEGDDDMMII